MRFRKLRRWGRNLFDLRGNKIYKGDTSECKVSHGARLRKCRIKLNGGSKLIVEEGVCLDHVHFQIDSGSTVIIEAGTVMEQSDICIWDHSRIKIGEQCRIIKRRFVVEAGTVDIDCHNYLTDGDKGLMPCIDVSHGTFILRIGSYNCINDETQLRCDESLQIGSYNMVSYGCDIWDTNTHVKYTIEEKKSLFEKTFPRIGFESGKPDTKAVSIGNGNWIGKNACILKGTRLGDNTIVATRAIASNIILEDNQTLVPPKGSVL